MVAFEFLNGDEFAAANPTHRPDTEWLDIALALLLAAITTKHACQPPLSLGEHLDNRTGLAIGPDMQYQRRFHLCSGHGGFQS